MIPQHEKERMDLIRKVESFRKSQSFALWKELSHFRFAYYLFSSNHLELKKLLDEHDSQDARSLEKADLIRRSRLQKKIAQALFNFLSAAYSLRETIKKERKKILVGKRDSYFHNPILVFGHELRNFFIHHATPSALSGSRSIHQKKSDGPDITFFFIRKEPFLAYLDDLGNGKNGGHRIKNGQLGKSYLVNYRTEIIISDFRPAYFDEVSAYYRTVFFDLLTSRKQEFSDLQREMSDLYGLAAKVEQYHRLPFPVSAPRYIRLLIRKL